MKKVCKECGEKLKKIESRRFYFLNAIDYFKCSKCNTVFSFIKPFKGV
jgi:hypothetical protein